MKYSCHKQKRVNSENILKICDNFRATIVYLTVRKDVEDSYGLHQGRTTGFTNIATQIAKQDNFMNRCAGEDSSVALALRHGLNSVDS